MDDTAALIEERGKTHGDWETQAVCSQRLKQAFWTFSSDLPDAQREAIDMILMKLSRISVGSAQEPDHWDDIAGYARLGRPNPVNDM